MPFADMLGMGAAAVFGLGVGARAFSPIIMPALGKAGSLGLKVGGKVLPRRSLTGLVSANKEMIAGAAIGGLIGGAVSDDTFSGALKGAAIGAAGMFGASIFAQPGGKLAKTIGPAAWSGAKMGWGAAKFAIRHPYMTAGAVGAGAYLATQTSPYDSPSLSGVNMNSKFNEEQLAAQALQESGVMPMGGIVSGAAVRNQRLMESTQGLVQGLHSSRH